VAEDVGALARSLARDFREAVDHARSSGRSTGESFRYGIRGVAEETRRGVADGLAGGWGRRHHHSHHHRHPYWYPGPFRDGPGVGPPPEPGYSPPDCSWPPPGGRRPPRGSGRPPSARGRRGYTPPATERHDGARRGPRRALSPLPPVRHRWDASTLAGLLVVLFGVAWLMGALRLVHLSAEGVVAVGLMLLGAAIIVTGRTDWSLSRRSWPVLVGVGLIAVLVLTSSAFGVAGVLGDVSFGSMSATASSGDTTIHGGFGDLRVNATEFTSGTLTVKSVAGQTFVSGGGAGGALPGNLEIDARVVAGQICFNGQRVADGVGASWHSAANAPPAAGTYALDVHQVFGQVQIGSRGCSPAHSAAPPDAPSGPRP
jgi:hypothetical protein